MAENLQQEMVDILSNIRAGGFDEREKVELITALQRIAHALETSARLKDPNFRPDFTYVKEHRANRPSPPPHPGKK